MTADAARVTAWVEEIAQAHAAATAGEWSSAIPGMVHNDPVGRIKGGYIASVEHDEDAAAIVAAHNNLDRLLAVVRGVAELAEEFERDAATYPSAAYAAAKLVRLLADAAPDTEKEGR